MSSSIVSDSWTNHLQFGFFETFERKNGPNLSQLWKLSRKPRVSLRSNPHLYAGSQFEALRRRVRSKPKHKSMEMPKKTAAPKVLTVRWQQTLPNRVLWQTIKPIHAAFGTRTRSLRHVIKPLPFQGNCFRIKIACEHSSLL